MRKLLFCVPMMILLLSACTGGAEGNEAEELALQIRGEYLAAGGCTATAEITADYGQRVYTYTMDVSLEGEETVLKVSEGRSILIKFVGMSDPDKDGYRTLTFEVNGILREQKVLDKTLEVLEDRKLKADKNNPCHLGSTIPGTVETVLVKEGDEVKVNQPLMIVEAMKMETTFVSKVNGKVDKLYVAPGDRVNTEDLLISFVLDEEEEK